MPNIATTGKSTVIEYKDMSRADLRVCSGTQPWLGCALCLSEPFRFRSQRAPLQDRYLDCESCPEPNSSNFSLVVDRFIILVTMAVTSETNYCKSRIFRMHEIFVYFVRGGFRTKIKCMRKVQSKSENQQRSATVRKFHAYERLESPGYEN